jgi:hypothetical protein
MRLLDACLGDPHDNILHFVLPPPSLLLDHQGLQEQEAQTEA